MQKNTTLQSARIVALALLFVLALVAAACGDDDPTSATGDDGSTSSSAHWSPMVIVRRARAGGVGLVHLLFTRRWT